MTVYDSLHCCPHVHNVLHSHVYILGSSLHGTWGQRVFENMNFTQSGNLNVTESFVATVSVINDDTHNIVS